MAMALEVIGWIGAFLLLTAYLLSSLKVMKQRYVYQALNIMGASMLGVSVLAKGAYPAAALEVAWLVIAIVAIIQLLRCKPESL